MSSSSGCTHQRGFVLSPLPPYFVDRDAHTFHVQTVRYSLVCRYYTWIGQRRPASQPASEATSRTRNEQTPGLRASLLWVRRYPLSLSWEASPARPRVRWPPLPRWPGWRYTGRPWNPVPVALSCAASSTPSHAHAVTTTARCSVLWPLNLVGLGPWANRGRISSCSRTLGHASGQQAPAVAAAAALRGGSEQPADTWTLGGLEVDDVGLEVRIGSPCMYEYVPTVRALAERSMGGQSVPYLQLLSAVGQPVVARQPWRPRRGARPSPPALGTNSRTRRLP